jgi:hypothetical protein
VLRNMSKKIRARGSRQADAQKKPAWLPHCSGPRKQHFKTRPPRQQQLSLEVSSAWRDRKKHLMIGFPSYWGSKPTRDRGAHERGGMPRAKTCLLKKRYHTNRRRLHFFRKIARASQGRGPSNLHWTDPQGPGTASCTTRTP